MDDKKSSSVPPEHNTTSTESHKRALSSENRPATASVSKRQKVITEPVPNIDSQQSSGSSMKETESKTPGEQNIGSTSKSASPDILAAAPTSENPTTGGPQPPTDSKVSAVLTDTIAGNTSLSAPQQSTPQEVSIGVIMAFGQVLLTHLLGVSSHHSKH
jgi:hypothetical protein